MVTALVFAISSRLPLPRPCPRLSGAIRQAAPGRHVTPKNSQESGLHADRSQPMIRAQQGQPAGAMKAPKTVRSAEALGRVRLSRSFFMRDFLHSERSEEHTSELQSRENL